MCFAVVFDLEFTAWPGSMEHRWMRPGEFREVVQIGAIKCKAEDFSERAHFNVFVKPRLNPELSTYLEKLTGVTNGIIAAVGIDFVQAYREFIAFAETSPVLAFGRDDLVLADNAKLYGLTDVPPLPRYANIAPWLAAQGVDPRGLHACDVAAASGADFHGRRHNALDDARSVAAGIAALLKKGAPHPLAQLEP